MLINAGEGMKGRPIRILLVEDDPADVYLALEALQRGKIEKKISVLEDGAEVMPFLRREGKYADAGLPDLILLDLNMPRKDGREVLAELKQDPVLKQIPVVVLTTSASDRDIQAAYELGANCYITKPGEFKDYMEMITAIEGFWFGLAALPPRKLEAFSATAAPQGQAPSSARLC